MFTGLIEETGTIERIETHQDHFDLVIRASTVLDDVKLGDSIAVDGACLTVTAFDATTFRVGLAPETLERTSFGTRKAGDAVNLERALKASDRLGGHMVQGHVDVVGVLTEKTADGDSLRLKISAPRTVTKYIVPKGYVALDGASLTIVEAGEDWFSIMLVAYTQDKIALAEKSVGARINIEVDILGKYVEKLVAAHAQPHSNIA